jgi:hypothetical protein
VALREDAFNHGGLDSVDDEGEAVLKRVLAFHRVPVHQVFRGADFLCKTKFVVVRW